MNKYTHIQNIFLHNRKRKNLLIPTHLKMNSIIKIQSETNPSIEYNLVVENGRPVSCTCKAFLYSPHKACKHMKEYSRHHATQSRPTPDLETLHALAAMDNFLTRRMNALEQREAALQLSCEHIIQRLITLDHQFTESIGLIRKRLTLHDQYLEQNLSLIHISEPTRL